MKNSKEMKDQRITLRLTPTQKNKLQSEANLYGMSFNSYCQDKLVNGKQRQAYANRTRLTRLVTVQKAINDLKDYLEKTDSDTVPKAELLPLVDTLKKGCDIEWDH